MLSRYLKRSYQFSQYDIAIIGAGPGGYVAAIKAGQLGFKTALIETRATKSLGGTCLNEGCIPAKAMLNMSHKYHDANHKFKGMGINVEGISLDFAQFQKKKDGIVKTLTGGVNMLCKKNKVDVINGHGKFVDQNTIQVGDKQITSKNIIIATGSKPIPFPGVEFDEKIICSSTGSMASEKLPQDMVVIGGGVIGLELGSVYARLGTQVTVIEFADLVCSQMDNETSKKLQQIMTKQGLKIKTSHKLLNAKVVGDKAVIEYQPTKGGDIITKETDQLLISTGRKAYTDGLGLDVLGLTSDKFGRVDVNEHLQTKYNNIFAIGDCIKGQMLAHKAEEEGIAVVEYLKNGYGHVNYNTIPGVIYTHPEVATVGKSEEELKAANVPYNKGIFQFAANSRAKAIDDTDGFVKVLSEKESDKLLGVHIIGPNAGEIIAECVLALEYGASSEDVARTCHAHPTISEAVKEAMLAVYDKPIHM